MPSQPVPAVFLGVGWVALVFAEVSFSGGLWLGPEALRNGPVRCPARNGGSDEGSPRKEGGEEGLALEEVRVRFFSSSSSAAAARPHQMRWSRSASCWFSSVGSAAALVEAAW